MDYDYIVDGNREDYPKGTVVELEEIRYRYGPKWMPKGLRGTVEYVDDAGLIHVAWENGSFEPLIPWHDRFRKVVLEDEHEQDLGPEL